MEVTNRIFGAHLTSEQASRLQLVFVAYHTKLTSLDDDIVVVVFRFALLCFERQSQITNE